MQTNDNPSGLTYPIVFADGEHFPEQAKNVQQKRDLCRWNSPYKAFRETRGIVELDQEVQTIAQELAKMIQNAPNWNQNWPIITPETMTSVTVNIPRL